MNALSQVITQPKGWSGEAASLPSIPKVLPILKLQCRPWFPGKYSPGLFSRGVWLPPGWLSLMRAEQSAGEDEEGSMPQGTTGSLAELTASLWDSDRLKLLPGTSRDNLGPQNLLGSDMAMAWVELELQPPCLAESCSKIQPVLPLGS